MTALRNATSYAYVSGPESPDDAPDDCECGPDERFQYELGTCPACRARTECSRCGERCDEEAELCVECDAEEGR